MICVKGRCHKLSNTRGIIVFGANGSGKTTLGRELAHILNFKHMDIEDYCFNESEIPYTNARSHEEYSNLMLVDIEKYRSFVISAVAEDFGEKISSMYELAVYITAPLEVRLKRIEQRERKRHGARICEGGDMYEQHLEFIDFVALRSLKPTEEWAKTLTCPIIQVDGTIDWRINAANIAKRIKAD